MGIQTVTPEKARELVNQGALLIDVRETDEHARERIAEARNLPLTSLRGSPLGAAGGPTLVFHCRSGARTRTHAGQLAAAAAGCEAYVLEGGIEAWKRAGLPVIADRRQPLEIVRQVQIAAGGLIVIAVVLGATLSPAFHLLAAGVGAGVLLSGITGSCAMARLLRLMPWNRGTA